MTDHELRPLNAGQLAQLFADLNPARITQRKQGGSNLSYLEAWDVRASLTRVFGFGGWSADVIPEGTKVLRMDHDIPALDYKTKEQKTNPDGSPVYNWRVTAQAILRLTIHQLGATYTEAAISSQTGPDVGEVGDFAIKTAESDALKRAAVNLGTTFGLSLYNKGATADPIRVVRADGQTPVDMVFLRAETNKRNEAAMALDGASQPAAPPAPSAPPAQADAEPQVDPDTGEIIEDQGQAEVLADPAAVERGRSALGDAFGGRQS